MKPAIIVIVLLSVLILAGCALTPVFEDCSFKEGQILNLKAETEQAEGWSGPPSVDPMRTQILFKEEGVLKTKRIGEFPRLVSSLKAERDVISYRLCKEGWLRVDIHYSEGFISSETAWFKAENFYGR